MFQTPVCTRQSLPSSPQKPSKLGSLDPSYKNRLRKSPSRKRTHRSFHRSPCPTPKQRRQSNSSNVSTSSTPTKKSPNIKLFSDRFIPSRSGSRLEEAFSLSTSCQSCHNSDSKDEPNSTYAMLLRNELLNDDVVDTKNAWSPRRTFRFQSPSQPPTSWNPFAVSPVDHHTERLLSTPVKAPRKISKSPFKVLDAPSLQDDFYLNLVDWSSQNVLAVGLGACVYLWSACTSKVTKLCDLSGDNDDAVTSVGWSEQGAHLAVGTRNGEVQIWDAVKAVRLRTLTGHSYRVGTIGWNGHKLASGSRDRNILLRDVRSSNSYEIKLMGHRQEVCGLKWSHFDEHQFASGGNDNKLILWDVSQASPICKYSEHTAAVKAITWSPHQPGLLASGGGTADRCIRFWNTLHPSTSSLSCVDTGSQVCNLMWSKNVNEIVSTHGYSLNQIIVWKYPSMTKLTTLTGHTYRVLYLATSPDGQTVVTGAGDETLRFWNIFPSKSKTGGRMGPPLMFPQSPTLIR